MSTASCGARSRQDLPIQLPSKFDLSLNLKTARALGLDVPMEMQQRANLVIQ
jgi:putative ABC transport system substrate-binding protein